tara:strand:+ start:453 stop:830 length:378 start_codon:yes stop_codon:yes gene_type:complete
MNKESKKILFLLGAGSLCYYFYVRHQLSKIKIQKNNTINNINEPTIKKGDLSKEVEQLQILINKLFGDGTIEVTGAYDKKTSELVKLIFYDTKELTNIELGEVSVNSVSFLNKLLDNIQKKPKNE